MREVFSNLLTDAEKYITGSENGSRFEEIPDSAANVCVRNNGIGIVEKHFDDVFKMFRRPHPQRAWRFAERV